MYQLRPFSEADYPAIAHIQSLIIAEAVTADEVRWEDQMTDERCRKQRWVAEVNGEVVGFGMYSQPPAFYDPHKFDVYIGVLAEHRRQGIGAALYRQVEEGLAPFDPVALNTGIGEEWTDGIRFAAQRGFVERMRAWESHLDLPGFDPAPWQGVLASVTAQGYTISSYADLMAGPDASQRLYRLVAEVRQDVPSTDPWQEVSYETWSRIFENPNFYPEGYLIGMKDGEWVGLSALWRSAEEGLLTTGLTAVQRQHRGTGLARALKVRAISFAQSQGYRLIKTWNEANNHRMLAINARLGFVRKPAWISYTRVVKP